jgi:hypothetical protein
MICPLHEWDTDMGRVGTHFLLSSSQDDNILFSYKGCPSRATDSFG